MSAWRIIFAKECLEMWRNFKWVWVPLVFILLGIMQPVSVYYTPDLLKQFGGLPAGSVVEIPLPSAAEVMQGTLSQFGMLGVLVLVLAFMNTVSGERNGGVLSLIMIKPVSPQTFILAKWSSMVALTFVSLACGYAAAWYYTVQLFDPLPYADVMISFLLYMLWLTFVMSFVLLCSVVMKSSGVIAFAALGAAVLIVLANALLARLMRWSPAYAADAAGAYLVTGTVERVWLPIAGSIGSIVVLVALCMMWFTRRGRLA